MNLDLPAGRSDAYKPTSPFELRHASTHRPLFVVVPERRLLAINSAGPRGAADFRLATSLLRTVADIVHSKVLRIRRGEPVRALLEVTWPVEPGLTVDEVIEALSCPTPRWRQMIELPQAATESMVAEAIDEARRLGGREVALIRSIHFTEGPAVQILHLGNDDALWSIRKLFNFVGESGLRASGDLHELVLADPTAVGRARARSILRVPTAYG